ncbi:MAG: hypothetical protein KGQ46_08885 [Hyphomicrobiales bacterium]|nr:hypothetical protein [Hyphomicrobiales bacterium]MDE2113392.1 hypothetical protein [Hyphomicrobiales bacterium]
MLHIILTSALLFSPKPMVDPQAGASGTPLTTCIVPPSPACIHHPDTYKFKKRIRACELDVAHQVSALYQWRQCIEANTEATISRSNQDVTYFKCRLAHQKHCQYLGAARPTAGPEAPAPRR